MAQPLPLVNEVSHSEVGCNDHSLGCALLPLVFKLKHCSHVLPLLIYAIWKIIVFFFFLFTQDLECDVSVENDNRQEWVFTLYDFDNSGRVTKEVCASLFWPMHVIYRQRRY